MAQVKFYRGLKALYNAETYKDGIYFAVDKKQIIVNGVAYGFDMTDPEINLISTVEFVSPDTLKFIASNGNVTLVTFPTATTTSAGLMSATDKEAFDKIPEVYATKEEVKQAIVGVYHFRGKVQTLADLPTEGLEPGDTYQVVEAFELDGNRYAKGTHVVWSGTAWHAMEGEEPGYSKEEANEKFIAWAHELTTNNKVILLPKGSKLIGTMLKEDGTEDEVSLTQMGIYEDGAVQQVEVGSSKVHLNLNSSDRPNIELPGGTKEEMAYSSDLSWVEVTA